MKKQDFENLIKSVKQAGKTRRGEMKSGRVFESKPADIRNIRQRFHKP